MVGNFHYRSFSRHQRLPCICNRSRHWSLRSRPVRRSRGAAHSGCRPDRTDGPIGTWFDDGRPDARCSGSAISAPYYRSLQRRRRTECEVESHCRWPVSRWRSWNQICLGTLRCCCRWSAADPSPPSMSRGSAIIRLGIGGAIGFAVMAGPWMFMLDAHYGSPTLPFFNAWFRSPYMINVNWSAQIFPFANWWDWIVFPFSLLREGTHHLQLSFRSVRLALAWCCILVSACLALSSGQWAGLSGRRWRPVIGILLPSEAWLYLYFGLSYVAWAKFFGDYRVLHSCGNADPGGRCPDHRTVVTSSRGSGRNRRCGRTGHADFRIHRIVGARSVQDSHVTSASATCAIR